MSKLPHLRGGFYKNLELQSQQNSLSHTGYQYNNNNNNNKLSKQNGHGPQHDSPRSSQASQSCIEDDDYTPSSKTNENNDQKFSDDQTDRETQHSHNQEKPRKSAKKSEAGSKIDTNQIPRPLMTVEDSTNIKVIETSSRLEQIPPSYKPIIYKDKGCATPRYIRCTTSALTNEQSTYNLSNIPFGCVIQPFADILDGEEQVEVVDYTETGPFRCNKCRAYINNYCVFVEGGNSMKCNLCKTSTKIPSDYYCPLDEYGQRMDKYDRVELSKGVYEIIAPGEYKNKLNIKPGILFVIEFTYYSFANGIIDQIIQTITSMLDYIPTPENTDIGFITYDQYLNIYLVPYDLNLEPQVVVLCDMDDHEIPVPKKDIMMNLAKDRQKIEYILTKIQQQSQVLGLNNQKIPGVIGGALYQATHLLLQEGGRVIGFTSQMPTQGFGKLQKRDNKQINQEKEYELYNPQIFSYESLGQKCLENRVSVDLFVFNDDYFDLSTISPLITQTGGSLYYYPTYNPIIDSEKLYYEIARNITRFNGYDIAYKLRVSNNLQVTKVITPYYTYNQKDGEMSYIDADKTITFLLKIDNQIHDSEVYIQFAILYTNAHSERVIRIINYAFNVVPNIASLFKTADADVCTSILIRKNSVILLNNNVANMRKQLIEELINILYSYRLNVAITSSAGQLVLPEALKYLSLYIFSFLKQIISCAKSDMRKYLQIKYTTISNQTLMDQLYPKVYPLHNIYNNDDPTPGSDNHGKIVLPQTIAASLDFFEIDGIFLIDNAETLYLYILKESYPQFLQELFGINNWDDIKSTVTHLDIIENYDFNIRVNNIVDQLRRYRCSTYQNMRIILEEDQYEYLVLNLLVEDINRNGESYAEFLCSLHKLIQNKLSL